MPTVVPLSVRLKKLTLAVCLVAAATSFAAAPVTDPKVVGAHNRAVALMGQFDYWKAEQAFAELQKEHPDWLGVQVNRAIATLNRQQEGDETLALAMVDKVLAQRPEHAQAHYVAGLLRLYLGSPDEAQAHFSVSAKARPDDAYAVYYLGQCQAQKGDFAAALEAYRKAIGLDPYLRSAYYGAFQASQRLRDRQGARAFLQDYQRLARNPRARLAEFRYSRMGPMGEVTALGQASETAVSAPKGDLFGAAVELARLAAETTVPAALNLLNAEGMEAPWLLAANGQSRLFSWSKNGLRSMDEHPLNDQVGVNAVLWGDYDNDGLTDAYLLRSGPNRLLRQTAEGWQDVTESTATGGGDTDSRDGAFFDADHDGDLDLFLVNADGPNELLNNNLDGSFRPLAKERGIAGDGGASRSVLPMDIDGDRDVDLLVLNAKPPHEIYLNDRLWDYRPHAGQKALKQAEALAILAVDLDADGRDELVSIDAKGKLTRWNRADDGEYSPQAWSDTGLTGSPWAQLSVLDADGDGGLDLLAVQPGGWDLFNDNGRSLASYRAEDGRRLSGLGPVLLDAERGPALLGLQQDGALKLWPAGPGRFDSLAVRLSGKTKEAETMRSNASGIGARLALRRGGQWTLPPVYRNDSGPGQSLQPLSIGLGGAEKADFLRIDWSDGVMQTELDLPAGGPTLVSETQRQLSSCPVLFAWDGEKYAFITDFLGVGGMGYAVAPGEYAEPRPWENLLMPDGVLQEKQGRYVLKFTEPMEEAAYIDAARLLSYDLPPGWRMVLDERMGIAGPAPTGKPRFYRHELLPAAAGNQDRRSMTELVRQADGAAVPVGELDRRFIGRLAEEQVLLLEFDRPLDAFAGQPILVADGWVEYPYSQTMFASWQAGASYRAPSLEARDADGNWHMLLEQFGYPAGMPRRMSVDLPELPPGSIALRLRGNMEVYWDRIAIAYAEPLSELKRTELTLAKAHMARSGFPRWTYAAQRRPLLDYNQRVPFKDTRHMAGFYTRFGPAMALVAATDDAVAVIGPGEELHLEYRAEEPPLAEGWKRYHVLETNGWAKDMDLFTRDGETVGPMPSSGKPENVRDALHVRYNNRFRDG